MRSLIYAVLIILPLRFYGQAIIWDRVHDLGESLGTGVGVAIEPYIEQGYLQFSNSMEPFGLWEQVPFMTMLGPDGTPIWDRVILPELTDYGWIISGGCGVDYRPGSGYLACGTASDQEGDLRGFVVRLDVAGNELWRSFIVHSSLGVSSFMVRFAPDGGAFVKSWVYSGANVSSLMTRLSPTGSLVWERTLAPQGVGSWSSGFALLVDGGFVMVGAKADGDNAMPWSACYDTEGDLLWERTYEVSENCMNFHQIESDGLEGFFVKGADYITVNTVNDSNRDVFAHIGPLGELEQLTRIGVHDPYTGSSGFKVVHGLGVMAFGQARRSGIVPGATTTGMVYVLDAMCDSLAGVNLGHRMSANEFTYTSRIYDMLVDSAANVVLFVGGTQGTVMQGWIGEEDPWLVGVDVSACPMLACSEFGDLEQLVGIPEHPAGSMMIYPNPVQSGGVMNLVLPDDLSPSTHLLRMSLFGSDGRMVRDLPIDHDPKGALSIPMNDLAPGAYSIMVEFSGRAAIIQKVMVL